LLTADQVKTFENFGKKTFLAIGDMAKYGKSSKFGEMLQGASTLGGAYTTSQGDIFSGAAMIAVPAMFSSIVAKSLMNPTGALRKWLTTGIKPPRLIQEAVKWQTIGAGAETAPQGVSNE